MSHIALLAAQKNHHPTFSNTFNRASVLWETHDVGGLSELDVEMARKCDEVAGKLLGNVENEKEEKENKKSEDEEGVGRDGGV